MNNAESSFSQAASVPTAFAGRYLQQLCKHWSHNLEVECTPQEGRVTFPRNARGADHPGDGIVTFKANDASLDIRIDATSSEQMTGLAGAVERHLDRFAFREGPLTYQWH